MNHQTRFYALVFGLLLLAALTPGVIAQTASTSKGPSKSDNPAERVHRFETNAASIALADKEPPVELPLSKLMEVYKIPGLSIAIIDNYQVVVAKGYGVIAPGSSSPVTTKTLFQAGSISKPVAATAALYIVEKGKLALYENVNEQLKSWKVPDNEFTKSEKVTLRRILSHTAGLTIHGFPGYDVNASLPTVVQILNGEKPANTEPVRVDVVPGTKFRYSGGGVTIEQLLMTDVTGQPFPGLLRETVLDKIGMTDSSYEQPLPPTRASATAAGTYSSGIEVHGKWHIYPEMAAAGLWTTPTDLSRFAIEIALSKQGKSNRILSEKMTRDMLTPVLDDVGMGFFFDKDNPGQFGHNGADEGFQAVLTMNAETGKGVVIMSNSDTFIPISDYLVCAVAREFGWDYKISPNALWALLLVAKVKGPRAALAYYDQLKESNSSTNHVDENTLNNLGYQLLGSNGVQDAIAVFRRNVELYPQSSNVYDSLGEAYAKDGQTQLAIQNYEKSIELNPSNQNGIDRLKKLKEKK